MIQLSKISDIWLGFCRRAPRIHTAYTAIRDQPEPALDGQPDGGAGGAGTMRRGVGVLISGSKTLIRNRQLFWFTILAGLVLAGNTIGQSTIPYIERIMQTDIIGLLVLNFLIEFATLFYLVFLLADLVMSISSKKKRFGLVFRGDCRGKKIH